MALLAASIGENTIIFAYLTVENKRPIGSAGSLPVKYNQSTALLSANSAEAPAKIKSTVSLFPQIFLTIEFVSTNIGIVSNYKFIARVHSPVW
jgi:hypothetical protein